MEIRCIKLKEYIDATTTPVEVYVSGWLTYKILLLWRSRNCQQLNLNENGFKGYNWKYLNNRPLTKVLFWKKYFFLKKKPFLVFFLWSYSAENFSITENIYSSEHILNHILKFFIELLFVCLTTAK